MSSLCLSMQDSFSEESVGPGMLLPRPPIEGCPDPSLASPALFSTCEWIAHMRLGPIPRAARTLCLLLALVPVASAQITVLSGASYQPVVAPGSFASLFGGGLAASVIVGSPGADGTSPKQLGGLTVTVGGAAADLVMVSPSQINFVVPLTAPFGTASVFVAAGLQTIAVGTASISPTAPAIFTADASGKGFGAILNGIDFSGPPFSLTTSAGGGNQVGTIVAVYGTGFRFAGGSVSAQPGDVSPHVTASATSVTGATWSLPVLYAGPAPGFEGLDQVNVQLAPDLDSNSDLMLTLFADSIPANSVYLLLRRSSPLCSRRSPLPPQVPAPL
jgi:uncharacterized protein (TIGR03437 family)